VGDADGTHQKQVTFKPGASFAPYITPDDRQIIYASNWERPRSRNFDLYLVGADGGEPVAVTTDAGFDGFIFRNATTRTPEGVARVGELIKLLRSKGAPA